MSLVNDMLKDLDQRRSNTGGADGRVRLTPASEFPKSVVKIKPAYLIGLLAIAVAVLGFTWIQLSTSTSGNNQNSPSSASPFEVAQQNPTTQTSVPDENRLALQNQIATDVTRDSNQQIPSFRPSADSPLDILSQAVQQRNANTPQPELYRPPADLEEPEGANDFNIANEAEANSGELVDVLGGSGIDDSVKDDAVISEDQQDTMAVQESLRLIADNKTEEAYANFESHIAENRYAHQSRETYAKLLLNDGSLVEAFNLIERGLDLAPNNTGFKKIKARVLIVNGRLLEAVELLVAKAPPVSEDVEYHDILASAQLATKDFAGAAISYSELVGADQAQGKYWYGYAAAQELLGNTNVARQAYSRAIQQATLSANLRRRSQDRLLALRE